MDIQQQQRQKGPQNIQYKVNEFINELLLEKKAILGRNTRRWEKRNKVKLIQLLALIKIWQVEDFHICVRKIKNNFHVVSNISFVNLKQLDLYQCQITTIQSLPNINAKKLEILKLSRNNITSLRPLVKLDAPNLRKLCIDKNQIRDLQSTLYRCSWVSKIEELSLQDYPESNIQQESLCFLAKLVNIPQSVYQKEKLIIYKRSLKRIDQSCSQKFLMANETLNKLIPPKQDENPFICRIVQIYDKKVMGYLVSDDQSSYSQQLSDQS